MNNIPLGMCAALVTSALHAAAPETVEVVVVTATRTEQPLLEVAASIASRDFEELRRQGFTFGTDELRGVPGVNFRRGEGDGDEFPSVTIRGVTGNHGSDTFLTMVDGVPLMGADEEVVLSEVPYDVVRRVEIVRGPVSALYGRGALAGAVNYLTIDPAEASGFGASVSAGSDTYRRGSLHGSHALDGGGGLLANIAYEDNAGWRERTARERFNFFGKLALPISDATQVSGYLNYLDRESELAGVVPLAPDGSFVEIAGGREGNLNPTPTHSANRGYIGALRLQHDFSDSTTVTITTQSRRIETDNRLNFYDTSQDATAEALMFNGFASEGTTKVLFGEAVLNWRNARHEIIAGASAEHTDHSEVESWFGQYGFTPECGFAWFEFHVDRRSGQVLNAEHPCQVGNTPQVISDATHDFLALFVQDEIRFGERLRLTIGGRYDRFERRVDFTSTGPEDAGGRAADDADAFSPKASISYRYGPGQFYAAYGRGFASNFGAVWQWSPSLYAREGGPTTLDSVELGWKVRGMDGRLEAEIAVFALEQKDRPVLINNPDPDGPPYLHTTGRRYDSHGFESAARWQLTDRTRLLGAYTYLNPKWDEYQLPGAEEELDLSGLRAIGVPRHSLSAAVEHDLTAWLSARLSFELYDDYPVTQNNEIEAGGYHLVNLGGSLKIPSADHWAVDVAVLNLLDEEYEFVYGDVESASYATPGPPRQFRITLRVSFGT